MSAGLAPPSNAPAVSVDYLRADMLAQLDPDDRATIWEPMVDYVARGQANGEGNYALMRMRGMLLRLLRCLHNREAKRACGAHVDFDPTTGW